MSEVWATGDFDTASEAELPDAYLYGLHRSLDGIDVRRTAAG